MQKAGGVIARTSAPDAQIREQLGKPEGAPRSGQEGAAALQATGFLGGAVGNTQLQEAGGAITRTSATDDQIKAQLWNPDHTPRSTVSVIRALHAVGLAAGKQRVATQLMAVRDPLLRPPATDSQVRERLSHPNGKPRTVLEVSAAVRANGLGVSNERIINELRAMRGVINRPSASDDQVAAQLRSPGGRVRSMEAVSDALHASGLGASSFRIDASLQVLRNKQFQPLASEE